MPTVKATITNDSETKAVMFNMDFEPDGFGNDDQAAEQLFSMPEYEAMQNADGTDADYEIVSITD